MTRYAQLRTDAQALPDDDRQLVIEALDTQDAFGIVTKRNYDRCGLDGQRFIDKWRIDRYRREEFRAGMI